MINALFPAAICAGVSVSDFKKMTIGEIENVLRYYNEREEARIKGEMQRTAFNAFWSGAFARTGRLPRSAADAFPSIFDKEPGGGINVKNWQQGADALRVWADRFNANKRR